MRKYYNLFLFLVGTLFATSLSAQHPTCDGIRYSNYIFSYDSTMGVQYGANTTFGGTPQNLLMDVFEPSGDMATNRPAIVFAFGGSFILGQRSDVHGFCRQFARLGYVACAIDYRLFDNFLFTDSTQAVDAVVKATHDMKAAIRYLREDAATSNTFKIDPNMIYAGGVSAGAVTACHVAYLDSNDVIPQAIIDVINANGGYEGNSSTNTQYSSAVQGVINYSGALKDADWIDAGEAPMYSAHDDGDPTVPYGSNSITVGFGVSIHLEGSGTMKTRCDAVGVDNELFTIANSGGHVSYLQNAANGAIVFAGTVTHLYDITCTGIVGIDDIPTPEIKVYPNPAQNSIHLEVSEQWSVYDYQLYDATGKQVRARKGVEGLDNLIDVADLPRGMYILRIQEGNELGQYTEKKLILN